MLFPEKEMRALGEQLVREHQKIKKFIWTGGLTTYEPIFIETFYPKSYKLFSRIDLDRIPKEVEFELGRTFLSEYSKINKIKVSGDALTLALNDLSKSRHAHAELMRNPTGGSSGTAFDFYHAMYEILNKYKKELSKP